MMYPDECSICSFYLYQDDDDQSATSDCESQTEKSIPIKCCSCFKEFHENCIELWYKELIQKQLPISCPMCRFSHEHCSMPTCKHLAIQEKIQASLDKTFIDYRTRSEHKQCLVICTSIVFTCILRICLFEH